MKKNLFGAVSVALALALAITSFGCESGNDDPVKRPEDNFSGDSVFTYVAAPNIYDDALGTAAVETPAGDSDNGYDWYSYKNGVLAYNRTTDSTKKSGNVSGKKVGDVIKTKLYTLEFDSSNNTWAAYETTTSLEVFKLVAYDDDTTADNSVKVVKAKETGTIGSLAAFDVSAPSGDPSTGYTAAVVTPGYVETTGNREFGFGNAKDLINAAIEAAEALKVDVYTEDDANFNEAVDDNIAELKEDLELIDAYWHGARKVIVSSVDATTTTSYVKENGSLAIPAVVVEGTAADPVAKGTYELTSGNYSDGSILITGLGDVSFNDANGTYTNGSFKGLIEQDYPEAGSSVGGAKGVLGNKTSRKVSISGGALTFKKTITSFANTDPLKYGFLNDFGSYTKYYDTDETGYVGTAEAGYKSYKFELLLVD